MDAPGAQTEPGSRSPARAAGPFLLGLLFAALAADGWRRWADVLVDFGHELYVPWRLVEGEVLYRDLAFLYGPLSQYANALGFALFGVSLTTLTWMNLALLAALALLVHSVVRRTCDRWAAAASVAALLCLSGFAHLVPVGNYNFVNPYSHEATHGTLLAFGMIALLVRGSAGRSVGPALLAGSCLGLAQLTRAEIGLAALAAAAAAIALLRSRPETAAAWRGRRLAAFAGAAALPPLVAFAAFSTAMAPGAALRAAGGAWWTLLGTDVRSNPFFVVGMGMEAPARNLALLAGSAAAMLAWLAALAGLDLLAARMGPRGGLVGAFLAAAVLAATTAFPGLVAWSEVARTLPLVSLAAVLASLYLAAAPSGRSVPLERLLASLATGTFSLVLLGKMLLNSRLEHYGFYLGLPGVLLLVAFLTWGAPEILRRRSGGGELFRWTAIALVAAAAIHHVRLSHSYTAAKSFPVGSGGDRLFAFDPRIDPRGLAVARTLEILGARARPGETLAVLPEGVLLNYLSRRRNPTPYTTLMPTEITAFGEEQVLGAFLESPPDLVALVHKETREFGRGPFGRDPRYGSRIAAWVRRDYEVVDGVMAEPFVDDRFGIRVLRRRTDR